MVMDIQTYRHKHTIRNIMLISIEQVIETAFKAKLSLVQVGGKLLGFPGRKTQQHRAIRFPEGEPNW